MADFSPEFMSSLGVIEGPFSGVYLHCEGPFFQWKGSYSELLTATRKEKARSSPALRNGFLQGSAATDPKWAGLGEQSWEEFLSEGYSTRAKDLFDAAMAKLDVKHTPSRQKPAISGGVWSVPKYLSGHPQSAIIRPRTALPPKDWHLSVSFSGRTEGENIALILAKLAKAAWDYQLKGGAVSITAHYGNGFNRPFASMNGFLMSVKIPLNNISALATALSVPAYRALAIPLAKGLSGKYDDSLIVVRYNKPGLVVITGESVARDLKAIEALGLT